MTAVKQAINSLDWRGRVNIFRKMIWLMHLNMLGVLRPPEDFEIELVKRIQKSKQV